MEILFLNGPNLNLLGKRQVEIYGNRSFEDFLEDLRAKYPQFQLHFLQSNHEGELIDAIQGAFLQNFDGIIINAGAFSHYSHAIADALEIFKGKIVEVHISNVFAREAFRHHSVISAIATGCIFGLGLQGYELALLSIIHSNA